MGRATSTALSLRKILTFIIGEQGLYVQELVKFRKTCLCNTQSFLVMKKIDIFQLTRDFFPSFTKNIHCS